MILPRDMRQCGEAAKPPVPVRVMPRPRDKRPRKLKPPTSEEAGAPRSGIYDMPPLSRIPQLGKPDDTEE